MSASTSTSETPTRSSAARSSSSLGPADGGRSSSATDPLRRAYLLGVDLRQRLPCFEPLDLALCSVLLRDDEVRGRADLLGGGEHPLDQLVDPLARGDRLAPLEVDELARQPVADRAPEVLLDQAVRQRLDGAALVVGPSDTHDERCGECRERLRLRQLRLAVAHPDLDRGESKVRPHAPPDLRVLRNRPRPVEEANVALELGPGREGVRYPAAWEEAREDLRPSGVKPRVDSLD